MIWNNPSGANLSRGATTNEHNAIIKLVNLATCNIFLSLTFSFLKGIYISRQNKVAALFNNELKLLRTAPKRTAKKNPVA